jgi:hypothetical protein
MINDPVGLFVGRIFKLLCYVNPVHQRLSRNLSIAFLLYNTYVVVQKQSLVTSQEYQNSLSNHRVIFTKVPEYLHADRVVVSEDNIKLEN